LFEEEDAKSTWVVVCQDTLKTRKRCEEVAKDALISGHRVVVDRGNMSKEQRAHWVKLAHEHWPFENKGSIMCLHFDTPYGECVRRCQVMEDHPTVPPAEAEKVVSPPLASTPCFMCDQLTANVQKKVGCQAAAWEEPSLDEGFSSIVTLKPPDVPFYRDLVMKLAKVLKVERSTEETMLGVS
jgi:hypothetical protein